ncbi:MAG: hypothetical protein JO086_12925, partial [Acidimicrobiia bacterium]|nr:hypothetical protein [Acidimicrobiia bacterium]
MARGIPAAPNMDPSALLLDTVPTGFESFLSGTVTLDAAAGAAANSDLAKTNLTNLGFRTGYQHGWRNLAVHQAIVVVATEFSSPATAALHKVQVARAWAMEHRDRFPVPGIAGAIGSRHVLSDPGKYPEAENTVVFRVERWELSIVVGSAVGPAGAVPVTDDLARQIAAGEL